jgi:hypothetical protein
MKERDLEEVIQHCDKQIELTSRAHAYSYYVRGCKYMEEGCLTLALNDFDMANRLKPEDTYMQSIKICSEMERAALGIIKH